MHNKMNIANSVKLTLVVALVFCGMSAVAQSSSSQPQKPAPAALNGAERFQVALGFDAAYADLAGTNNTFWLTGGHAEVAGRVYRGISLVGNFTGLEANNTGASSPLNLLTVTFGPRYTWTPKPAAVHKVSLFGEGLAGLAHGFNSVFPATPTASSTANSLAVQLSAGADVAVSPYFSIRLVQGGWLRTALPNSTGNSVQNNFEVGAGLVFHSKN